MTAFFQSRVAVVATALVVGPIAGAIAVRKPVVAALLCLAVVLLFALASLGERAFPWAIVLVAVAPWYPLTGDAAVPPVVRQLYLCIAIIAAVLVPFLWTVGSGTRGARPSRMMVLFAILALGFVVLVYQTVGLQQMIQSGTVGFLIGGFAFLCARRFSDPQAWLAACFGGFVILGLFGMFAFATDPTDRVGQFTGYGITYGALVAVMLPPALAFAAGRSRTLAVLVGVAGMVLLILSQSRSAWLGTMVAVLYVVLLLARLGNMRMLAYVGTGLLIALIVVFSTGSLHKIVETRLSSSAVTQSQSATHRVFSLHYVGSQVSNRPIFGALSPGYAAEQVGAQTDLGAVDNGYLSIAVDMGLLGLLVALVPIGVAVTVLWRSFRLGVTPMADLALALGILSLAVVTAFYDTFYWAQLDLMLFTMGGVLSARLPALKRTRLVVWRTRPAYSRF